MPQWTAPAPRAATLRVDQPHVTDASHRRLPLEKGVNTAGDRRAPVHRTSGFVSIRGDREKVRAVRVSPVRE